MNPDKTKKELRISRISILIIFLALLRTIAEPLRMQYYSASPLPFTDVRPFLWASLACALGLLGMVVCSFFGKSRIVILTGVITIALLVAIKITWLS